MPVWFLILLGVCACFAVAAAFRGIGSEGIYIGGERVNRITILLAGMIIVIAFGLFAATQLGFIADHAP